jgi:hypothetical protein
VMFVTRERQAGSKLIEGRVMAPLEHMLVRKGSESTYHYQVAWTDYTLKGRLPDAKLSPEEFERLRKARLRIETVEENLLERVSDYHVRLWDTAFRRLSKLALAVGMSFFKDFAAAHRHNEHVNRQATNIQRVYKGYVARNMFFGRLWDKRRQDKLKQKLIDRKNEQLRNARAKAAGGFTVDEVHYFDTKAELDNWAAQQLHCIRKLAESLIVSRVFVVLWLCVNDAIAATTRTCGACVFCLPSQSRAVLSDPSLSTGTSSSTCTRI